MKKILTVLLLTFAVLLTSCGGKDKEEKSSGSSNKIKVGVVLSTGGLGDKSFNDSAYRGLQKAIDELGIIGKYVEPASSAEDENFLRDFAENDFDLIVGVGFAMKNSLEKVASEYPDKNFALVDEAVDLPNVSSLVFSEDEGSFVVGALAAMMSETNTIGFVGGMKVPLIQEFQKGYIAGAKYVNPDIKVMSVFTDGANAFNDPVRGKENALSLISQGGDVIYHAAGGTGNGVFAAAKDKGVFAIGVDSNQDAEAKGVILTSMVKNVDVAVFNTIKEVQDGTFTGGVNQFTLADKGVSTTDFKYTKDIIGEKKLDELKAIEADIISKKIDVPAEVAKVKE